MKTIRLSHLIVSVIVLFGAMLLLTVSIVFWMPTYSVKALPAEIEAIVTRTAEITGAKGAEDVWLGELRAGRISLKDFTRTSFTGTAYLLKGGEDDSFAADLSYALYGNADQSAAINEMLREHSRIFVMESLLYSLNTEYAPDFSLEKDQNGTRVISVTLEKPIQDEDGLAFGVRRSGGLISISGTDARTDFYIDGNLRAGQLELSEQQGEMQKFSLLWDTRRETSGTHAVQVLLRTSDGRGTILTGGDVQIPEFFTLINDGVQLGSLPNDRKEVWYALDAADRNAYVNFVDCSGDLAVSLYNMNGEIIGSNDLPGIQIETLRGKKQDLIEVDTADPYLDPYENIFYVRVERGASSTTPDKITYLMIQSKEVAVDSAGTFYAVVSDVGMVPTPYPKEAIPEEVMAATVELKDFNHNPVSIERSDLTFLPINGCLSSLNFFGPTQEEKLDIYPVFSSDNPAYAYVFDGSFNEMRAELRTYEGYAAQVEIVSESSSGSVPAPVEQIPIMPSRNVVRIRITDFDGIVHEYPLYILAGADLEGYDISTLNQFPESYRSGLWLIHNLMPTYQLVPYYTGIRWPDLMEAQDYKDRSLVSDVYDSAWVKDGSPVYDGSSWRSAKTEVIAYFLDPRNFFDPITIFQFEKLSFDANIHTIDGVRSMIKGSFMESGETDFGQILLQAGTEANISPYFLASRIIQEMGRQGQSLLASGTLPDYEGIYNFYNIGSTPNPDVENGALINGAKYAMWGSDASGKVITAEEAELLLPWTSPDLAIRGGAHWIARSYIDIGQDTLYFQKFDVLANEDGLFKHQYAQNVQMAYSEGVRYYRAYLSQNMIAEPFLFMIPVYEDMPDSYGSLPGD